MSEEMVRTLTSAVVGALVSITGIWLAQRGENRRKFMDVTAASSDQMWKSLSDRERWLWGQFQAQFEQLEKKNRELEAEITEKDAIITKQSQKIAALESRIVRLERKDERLEGDGK